MSVAVGVQLEGREKAGTVSSAAHFAAFIYIGQANLMGQGTMGGL
jgi:hypothetical protein